jgi:ABC-type Zn uptake system ZnuABC Zn-binding protein ZnuA
MSETKNKLENLHELLAQKLLDKLRDPEVKASDLNVARQFLKDNNIDCIPTENGTISKLAEELPFKLSDLKDIVGEDTFN